ncbi:MAG: MBL fold metallo-hydrolase [Acidobacteria bacterium]|nr:MBL fold metallo-hydrolase [Acidobacteriota bacterium]
MKLRFWGVRGSTPTPGREYLKYGGNTSCLELRANGNMILLDCGSGLRELGKAWVREFHGKPLKAFIFLTHYHWDHIQGIPFFEPLYNPENQFHFHCFSTGGATVRDALEGQMTNPYFPVDMNQMKAHRSFRRLGEESIEFHGVRVTAKHLFHPQGCLGYRVETNSEVIVYATDNEAGDRAGDRNLRELAQGADVLIYDAQYTPEEYDSHRKGWGHSTWRHGAQIAAECGVKELILFHHDPDHNDSFLDQVLPEAQAAFPSTRMSAEGMEIEVSAAGTERIRYTTVNK